MDYIPGLKLIAFLLFLYPNIYIVQPQSISDIIYFNHEYGYQLAMNRSQLRLF